MEIPLNGEPVVVEEKSSTAEPSPVLVRAAGGIALLLVFFASMGLTAAYFLNSSATPGGAQVASAAEAATTQPDPFAGIELQGESAYVLDLRTGHVLFSRNPDTQLPLASLTKVALALAVSEVLAPDTIITIPYDTAPAGSAERLARGEKWTLQNVLNFTLIASSNGGADILAAAADADIRARYPEAPAGSAALWRMNDIARNLGLANTYFLNDNGLDLSTTQAGAYGSARDVAALFAHAASTSPATFAGTTRDGMLLTSVSGAKTSAFNTNQALGSIPGLIMGKTGYTDLAGGNLAIVFDVGPAHPVVAVIMHSTESGRFDDMKKLVTAAIQAIGEGR
jgi:D-alanyl-D-alanine carboxypeptidase (penicillin-binding protein 5/6)